MELHHAVEEVVAAAGEDQVALAEAVAPSFEPLMHGTVG
jgi:hypothetical protein